MTEPAFDETIHPNNRLQICAMLAPVDSLAFSTVRDALGVSDSVLSKQVKVLQTSGYLDIRRETLNSRIHSWLALTPLGRTSLAAHLEYLRRIVDTASGSVPS